MTPKLKGVLYIFASAAFLGATFIASKQAMLDLTPLGFSAIWFTIATIWGVIYYAFQSEKVTLAELKPHGWTLLWLGLSNSGANFFFFSAIQIADPTVIAFFGRGSTLFAVLMGVVLLKERLTGLQWLGGLVTVIGAGLMTYHGGSVIWLVLLLSMISNFFMALSGYFAKLKAVHVPVPVMGITRTLILAITLGTFGLLSGQLAWPSLRALLWMIGGSFFGPFLSYIMFYRGLRTIDLSQATMIQATQPLFVAFYGFVLFGSVIALPEFAGGLVILAGVLMIIIANNRIRYRNKLTRPETSQSVKRPVVHSDGLPEVSTPQE
jgi:drug/metabolite transporter (DMT)-like permease